MSGLLNDQSLEKILTVNAHCVFGALDEIVSFDTYSDEDREKIVKIVTKAIEVTTIVTCGFFQEAQLNFKKLEEINQAIREKRYDEANDLLARGQSKT